MKMREIRGLSGEVVGSIEWRDVVTVTYNGKIMNLEEFPIEDLMMAITMKGFYVTVTTL